MQTLPDMLRLCYIGTDISFHEILCATADSWNGTSSIPDQVSVWTSSDNTGPEALAAVEWPDAVRLYYFQGQNIVLAALDSGNWATVIIPNN
jgi:hypothetical protein